MQIKTIVRYHCLPVRIAIIKKSANNKYWRKCREKGTLLYCWWECKLVQSLWRTVWRFCKILKIELPYDPARPLLELNYSLKKIHPNVHSSTIYNSQDICCCSVTQWCLTLCDPMDCSSPGFPDVLHHLPELAQTHVYWVGDAIQPSCPLLSPSPPAFNLAQHQGLSNESVLRIGWPKYCNFSFSISPSNEYSGLISLGFTGLIYLQSEGLSRVFSNTTVQKCQFFGVQPSLWSKSCIQTWLLEKP